MALIPDPIIEQVREAHDIVDLIGRAVPLKSAGRNFKALCPFHDEKTPSFTVNPERQTFKCFGCGKGGNVFHFLMETQGLSFPEAVRQLAAQRGIPIPDERGAPTARKEEIDPLRRALAFAHRFYVECLQGPEGSEARAYLERRGYDQDAQRSFGLGYAPPAWDRLALAGARANLAGRHLEDAGLLLARREGDGHYDRFRHRIIFPIADMQGRLITFAGRTLDPEEQAKYLNGPETPLFKKANTLYMLHRARDAVRRTGEALLMEGYTDVLMCHRFGFDRAVAGMGTALTERQARLLKRFGARVTLLYDADAAGRLAAERALDVLLVEGLEVRVALLPEGRDVDEILLEEGAQALDRILEQAQGLFAYKLGLLAQRHDLTTPRGRSQAGEALVASIVKVRSPVERDQLLRMVAERLGGGVATEGALRQVAASLAGGGPRPPARLEVAGPDAIRLRSQSLRDRDFLGALVHFPSRRDGLFAGVGPEDFTAPAAQALYNAMFGLHQKGAAFDVHRLMARFGSDSETLSLLADLPSPEGLEERVQDHLRFLERQRLLQRQVRRVKEAQAAFRRAGVAVRSAGAPARPEGAAPGIPAGNPPPPADKGATTDRTTDPVGGPAEPDPDDFYFGEDPDDGSSFLPPEDTE